MEPYSLLELTLEESCWLPPCCLKILPNALKEQLLTKLSKRGLCNDSKLSFLVTDSLSSLDLRDCSLSNEGLSSLQYTRNLKVLFLPQPPSVSESLLEENGLLIAITAKRFLQVVSMNGLTGVTDRVVSVLVGGSPHLCELQLASTSITNTALSFLSSLTHLSALNIAKNKISDQGLYQLLSGAVGDTLKELRVEGCVRLTDKSIEAVCKFCTRLNILCIHHCPKISDCSRILVGSMTQRVEQITWTVY